MIVEVKKKKSVKHFLTTFLKLDTKYISLMHIICAWDQILDPSSTVFTKNKLGQRTHATNYMRSLIQLKGRLNSQHMMKSQHNILM